MPIRIVIVSSHHTFAEALAIWLREAGMDVVHIVGVGNETIPVPDVDGVDVIVVDGNVPGRRALPKWDEVRERWPDVKVLLLSSSVDRHHLDAARRAGFHGCLTKDASIEVITDAIESVHGGEHRFAPPGDERRTVQGRVFPGLSAPLTQAEREVLRLLADGADGRTVADRLGLPLDRVRSHIGSLLTKLSVHSGLEAATRMIRNEPGLDHPHLDQMDEEQILAHLHSMHPRGMAPYYPIELASLEELHQVLHRWIPPSPA